MAPEDDIGDLSYNAIIKKNTYICIPFVFLFLLLLCIHLAKIITIIGLVVDFWMLEVSQLHVNANRVISLCIFSR